jgi:hypothetical protein
MAWPQYSVVVDPSGNPTTGTVGVVGNPLEQKLVEATAFPMRVDFFPTDAAALAYVKAHGGGAGNVPGLTQIQGGLNTATGAITSTGNVISDLTHFLTQPNIWLRAAEVVAGFLLLYIGLKAAVSPGGVQPATRSAGQTAKSTGKALAKGYRGVAELGLQRAERKVGAGKEGRQARAVRTAKRPAPSPGRYTVTERTPISGEMGGTRTVRYRSHTRPDTSASGSLSSGARTGRQAARYYVRTGKGRT